MRRTARVSAAAVVAVALTLPVAGCESEAECTARGGHLVTETHQVARYRATKKGLRFVGYRSETRTVCTAPRRPRPTVTPTQTGPHRKDPQ